MGYHIAKIPKGEYGEFSKIEEEFLELKDALNQNNKLMALIELSDLLGAMKAFLLREYGSKIKLKDLKTMSKATKRAFKTGERK